PHDKSGHGDERLGLAVPGTVAFHTGGIYRRGERRGDAKLCAKKICQPFRAKPRKSLRCLEAPVGIEPTNRGFADLCLTTWLRRRAIQGMNLRSRGSTEKPQTCRHSGRPVKSMGRACGSCATRSPTP